MAEHKKMKVVNGVRYRSEDAPDERETQTTERKTSSDVTHKARRPSRSARSGEHADDE